MSSHPENPFARGKSKLVANLMLDGKKNDEIRGFWKDNGFEEKLGVLNKELLHGVRSALKSKGLIDEFGFPTKKEESTSSGTPQTNPAPSVGAELGGGGSSNLSPESAPRDEVHEFQLHPDWDVLTPETINHIVDPVLRAKILNYKTEVAKVKQTLKPEYATQGEIDLLRNEVSGKMGDIQETLNTLISKLNDPEPPEESDPEEPEEEPEDETPSPKKPLRLTTAVNRLEAEQETEPSQDGGGDDDLIEVEGVVIIRKHVGFTAKSVMYYEIDKAGGFQGNLADYVNSCIEDAHKGRDIGLAVVERKMIR